MNITSVSDNQIEQVGSAYDQYAMSTACAGDFAYRAEIDEPLHEGAD
jgi:hypothetical protein